MAFRPKLNKIWILLPLLLPVMQSSYAEVGRVTAELKVTGKITPSSCSLTLGADTGIAGEVNYENTSSYAGSTTLPYTSLGVKTLSSAMSLACEGDTLVGVKTTDNRSATPVVAMIGAGSPPHTFNGDGTDAGKVTNNVYLLGLGSDAKNNYIGAYSGTFINLKVDGVKAYFSTCMNESALTGGRYTQGGALPVGDCPAGQSHQVLNSSNANFVGKVYTWDYKVEAVITDPKLLDPSGWKLNGSVTVQINYL